MSVFKNEKGNPVLMKMVKAIQDNKAYLGEVDGLIGDGDHGMNMNKGFWLPKNFCMLETANDAGTAVALPGIDNRLERFADNIINQLTLGGTES